MCVCVSDWRWLATAMHVAFRPDEVQVCSRVRILTSEIPGAHGGPVNGCKRKFDMNALLAEHVFAQICERRAGELRPARV